MAIHSARFLESGELFVARIRCLALHPPPTSRARDFCLAFPFVTAFAQPPERPFPWPQAFDTFLIAGRPGAQLDQLSPAGPILLSVTIPLRDSPEWTLFGVRLDGSSASAANCRKPKSGSWRRGLNCTGPHSRRTGADCKPAGGRSGSRRSVREDTSHGTSGLPGNRL